MITDIDPQMRYCVRCNDEYIPEMSNCGVCGAVLLNGVDLLAQRRAGRSQHAARKGALTAGDDIVTVFKASLADVRRLEQQMKRENIGTLIVGDKPASSCGKGCCGGGEIELRVRREDAMAAMAVIEADFVRQTASHGSHSAVADYGFNPEGESNSCPACGCSFSMSGARGAQSLTCPDCGLCFG